MRVIQRSELAEPRNDLQPHLTQERVGKYQDGEDRHIRSLKATIEFVHRRSPSGFRLSEHTINGTARPHRGVICDTSRCDRWRTTRFLCRALRKPRFQRRNLLPNEQQDRVSSKMAERNRFCIPETNSTKQSQSNACGFPVERGGIIKRLSIDSSIMRSVDVWYSYYQVV